MKIAGGFRSSMSGDFAEHGTAARNRATSASVMGSRLGERAIGCGSRLAPGDSR
jgi:hypothetical protein